MDENEFQQRSLGWARRSFWVGFVGLALAAVVFAWTVNTAEGEPEQAAPEATAASTPDATSAAPPAEDEDDEVPSEARLREAYPMRCCAWYAIGSAGTMTEVAFLTVLKTGVFAAAVALLLGIRDRWRYPGQDFSSCSGVLFVLFTAVLCAAFGLSAPYVSDIDPPAERRGLLAVGLMVVSLFAGLVVGIATLRLTVRIGAR